MSVQHGSIAFIGLVYSLIALVSAEETTTFKPANLTKCYECNSFQDRNCEDPFKSERFELKECIPPDWFSAADKEKYEKPSGCRKVYMTLPDTDTSDTNYRFVRGCAFHGMELDQEKRIGSRDVRLWESQCIDGDGCNTGSSLSHNIGVIIGLLLPLGVAGLVGR